MITTEPKYVVLLCMISALFPEGVDIVNRLRYHDEVTVVENVENEASQRFQRGIVLKKLPVDGVTYPKLSRLLLDTNFTEV